MTQEARIIVVDDDEVTLTVLCDLLEDKGYAVDRASDGATALSRMLDGDYPVAILDLGLPFFQGDEVFDALREHKKTTQVIFVTGNESFDTAMSLVRRGACDYLVKPIELEALLAAVEAALRKRELFVMKDRLIRESMAKVRQLEKRMKQATSQVATLRSELASAKEKLDHYERCVGGKEGVDASLRRCVEDLIETRTQLESLRGEKEELARRLANLEKKT